MDEKSFGQKKWWISECVSNSETFYQHLLKVSLMNREVAVLESYVNCLTDEKEK